MDCLLRGIISFLKLAILMRRMKVLLDENPHIPIQECRELIEAMEKDVKALRRRELRKKRVLK